MTVILVLFTFMFFLLIDHFMTRNKPVILEATKPVRPPVLMPSLVNGFRLPETLRYHPGHTWALGESPSLTRVGMDEFAAKLLGTIDSITLPTRGSWVRQGQKLATITRGGKTVTLLSPIEGSISEINEAVLANPNAKRLDSYNEGWLVMVQAPDQKTSFRNLLVGKLAKWWMEEAVTRMSPAFAQDGGEAIDDFAGENWEEKAKEYFLN